MLKTLIIATVLLPALALAQRSQQLPQPRQPGQKRLVPVRLARERQLLHPVRSAAATIHQSALSSELQWREATKEAPDQRVPPDEFRK